MRRNPSKFFPFEKPIYTDLVFYAFLFIAFTEMRHDLNEFYSYGDLSRLILLLIEFANSIFVAWIISMPLNWIRGVIISKINSRNEAKTKERDLLASLELNNYISKPIYGRPAWRADAKR